MNKVIGVILAGGRSKRMGILCQPRPKPLLPFGGKYNVIDFTLSNCYYSGIQDVSLLTAHKESQIADYIEIWQALNRNCLNISLIESQNRTYSGTADAIAQNIERIKDYNPDAVIILAADHVYSMDYREMLEFHYNTRSDITVCTTRVPIASVNRFGVVYHDDSKRIINFVEKPSVSDNNLASMGIYIFNTETLIKSLEEDSADPSSIHDFGYSIIPELINRYRVSAYEYQGYWQDIGTPQSYFRSNFEFVQNLLNDDSDSGLPLLTGSKNIIEDNIFGYDSVSNNLMTRGCVIKGKVQNSILYPGVWVEKHAIVKDSILLPNVLVGYHSVIKNSIVDEGVHVSRFSYVGFNDGQDHEKTDITVLGKDSIIPPYTIISQNSKVPPYSLVGHPELAQTPLKVELKSGTASVSHLLSLLSYL
jgi:glucose-1-phosphate adenylyltransferase